MSSGIIIFNWSEIILTIRQSNGSASCRHDIGRNLLEDQVAVVIQVGGCGSPPPIFARQILADRKEIGKGVSRQGTLHRQHPSLWIGVEGCIRQVGQIQLRRAPRRQVDVRGPGGDMPLDSMILILPQKVVGSTTNLRIGKV